MDPLPPDTMEELVSYAIGCMLGRYSLDAPGLIYANTGGEGFDPSRYTTFPADADGIVPLTDTEWFDDDAAHRLSEFISVAWDAVHLEDNLTFLADNLSPKKNESSRETLRRYLSDSSSRTTCRPTRSAPSTGSSRAASRRPFSAWSTYTAATRARSRGCAAST